MTKTHYALTFTQYKQRSSCGVIFRNFSEPTQLVAGMSEIPARVTCKRCRAALVKGGYMTDALFETIDSAR